MTSDALLFVSVADTSRFKQRRDDGIPGQMTYAFCEEAPAMREKAA